LLLRLGLGFGSSVIWFTVAIFIEPEIDPKNYDTFRRMPDSDLPDTYDEWLYLSGQQNKRLLVNPGHTVRSIKVYPDEFARHCDETGTTRDLKGLRNFAAKKSGLQQD
jgi:hypothetical protein